MSEPTGFEKLPEAHGKRLPLDAVIPADGFVKKDGKVVFDANEGACETWELAVFEDMAKADPNHDWRVHLFGTFSDHHYQRQGDGLWVLYKKGPGLKG